MSTFKTTLFLIGAAAFIAACTGQSTDDYSVNYDASSGLAIEEKQGDTTLRGTIKAAGSNYFLMLDDGSRIELDSYAITLQDYAEQRVTITGQYSGDTLFVGAIE